MVLFVGFKECLLFFGVFATKEHLNHHWSNCPNLPSHCVQVQSLKRGSIWGEEKSKQIKARKEIFPAHPPYLHFLMHIGNEFISLSEGKWPLVLLMLFVTMQIYQDIAKKIITQFCCIFLKSHLFPVKIPYYLTVLQFLNQIKQYNLVI